MRHEPRTPREPPPGVQPAAPLSEHEARALPVYLYGRGLQMIAKRLLAGQSAAEIVPQVGWIAENAAAIADAAASAL